MSRRVLLSGSSGLIGSEAVAFFDARGWEVPSVDDNVRRVLFGAGILRELIARPAAPA